MLSWGGKLGHDEYEFDDQLCRGKASKGCSTTNYLCSTNDKGGQGIDPVDTIPHAKISTKLGVTNGGKAGATPGTYIVSYHVRNKRGVGECAPANRTVIVE